MPGCTDAYRDWCGELRARREEFGISRTAAGVSHTASWLQADLGLTVTRLEAIDPDDALRRLDMSDDPFDRWYRECELDIHGRTLREAVMPTDVIADHRHGTIDPFDPYMAMAIPLLPGTTADFRSMMQQGVASGRGPERARRWGIKRLTVHLQPLDDADVAIYEVWGDLATMVRSIAGEPTSDMSSERDLFLTYFGLDLGAGDLPLPEAAFAWSSGRSAASG